MSHCGNLSADRSLGEYWEKQFCSMMADAGKMFTPLQIGRPSSAVAYSKTNRKWDYPPLILPDVTIWTSPGEHHEIKHKNLAKNGRFGLEEYRLESLIRFAKETQQDVRYTIHDHKGNREDKTNRKEDWVTASVLRLATATKTKSTTESWVNSKKKLVPIFYWMPQLFEPLFKEEET